MLMGAWSEANVVGRSRRGRTRQECAYSMSSAFSTGIPVATVLSVTLAELTHGCIPIPTRVSDV